MVCYCLQLVVVVTRDYFYCLQSHHRPVNYLSTAVQSSNRLLRFWTDGGFVYYKRVSSPSFLFWSQFLIVKITSWFAIALDEIRTRRILRGRRTASSLSYGLLRHQFSVFISRCEEDLENGGESNKTYVQGCLSSI